MIFAKFDLDSTLVNSDELIALALAEQGYMLNPDINDKFEFNFIEGYAPPPDFQWDVFFYRLFTERFDELKPIDEHVNEFLESVYDGRVPLHVLTARTDGAIMHHACMRTLENCFPNVEFIVSVVSSGDVKINYMDHADIIFEDRRKTALQMSREGIICIMPNKSYNKMPKGLYSMNIGDVELQNMKKGDIIRFDNYKQVLDSCIELIISPVKNLSHNTL